MSANIGANSVKVDRRDDCFRPSTMSEIEVDTIGGSSLYGDQSSIVIFVVFKLLRSNHVVLK
jgi:hypothetical protein